MVFERSAHGHVCERSLKAATRQWTDALELANPTSLCGKFPMVSIPLSMGRSAVLQFLPCCSGGARVPYKSKFDDTDRLTHRETRHDGVSSLSVVDQKLPRSLTKIETKTIDRRNDLGWFPDKKSQLL